MEKFSILKLNDGRTARVLRVGGVRIREVMGEYGRRTTRKVKVEHSVRIYDPGAKRWSPVTKIDPSMVKWVYARGKRPADERRVYGA